MYYTVSVSSDLPVCERYVHILVGWNVFVIHHACSVLITNVLTYSTVHFIQPVI